MRTNTTVRLSVFAAVFFLLLASVGTASADTYNVNASVPYEAPTQAATVSSLGDGTTVNDAQQIISGTCQVKNPPTIISVVRGSTVLGSTECVAGVYSVAIMLLIGQNSLVVRTANASGIYGPDSATLVVTFEKPIVAEPLPSGVNQPTSETDRQAATNQGGLSGLMVTTEAPYTVLPDTKIASVHVVVNGGQRPYVLQLKWGDGSTESHSLDQAGTYEFTHTYVTRKTYNVYVYVRDVLGAYTEYMYAVVSGQKVTGSSSTKTTSSGGSTAESNIGRWRIVGIVWYYWLLIIIIILFLLSSYIFGYRRGRERSEIEAEKRLAAKKRRKRSTKK